MGEVWRAEHEGTREAVAIKIMGGQRAASDEELVAFRQEVRAVAALSHPHVVEIYDFGRLSNDVTGGLAPGSPYLVMELARGRSLADLGHTLAWPQIRAIALGVLEALAHAHARDVVHRDLKPGNVLLRTSGSPSDVLVSDFGLAWALGPHEEGVERPANQAHGTPGYMAPEQILGRWRDMGPWTDLYALGALVWELACGQVPFPGESTTETLRAQVKGVRRAFAPMGPVPPGLEPWLDVLLAPHPHRRHEFAARAARGLMRLDGLSDGAIELRSARPTSGRADTGLGLFDLRPSPLTGRDDELAELEDALEHVCQGRGARAVVIRGAQGMGKTHLARALCQRAHERGAAMALRTIHEQGARADEGIQRLLSYHLRTRGLDREACLERIDELLATHALPDEPERDIAEDRAALIEVLHPSSTPTYEAVVSSVLRGQGPRAVAMTRMIRRMSRKRPLVVWLDDAQWGAESLGFAAHTLAYHDDVQVLFVLTVRDDALEPGGREDKLVAAIERQPGSKCLQLGPLGPLAHAALVQRLLPMHTELARAIESSTEGSPLFVVQMVSDCIRRGVLEPGPKGWRLREGARLELPRTIQQLWLRKLERALEPLGEHALASVELAALLGKDVDVIEWTSACTHAGVTPPAALLDALIDGQLASPTSRGWSFFHSTLRQSICERAEQSGRAERLHAACADTLRALGALGAMSERLAGHELGARRAEDALEPMLEAVHWRHMRGEFERARALHDQWQSHVDRLGLGTDDPRRVAGLVALANLHVAKGDMTKAEETSRLASALVDDVGDDTLSAQAHVIAARVARKQGKLSVSTSEIERARALFEGLRDTRGVGFCDLMRGEILATRGRHAEAEELLRSAQRCFAACGRRDDLARSLMIHGDLRYHSDDRAGGDELTRQAMSHFSALGNQIGQAFCLNIQGEGARRFGDLDLAATRYRSAHYLLERLGSHEAIFPAFNLVTIDLLRGHYEGIGEIAPSLVEGLRSVNRPAYLGLALVMLACHDAFTRDWERWEDHFEEGSALIASTGLVDADVELVYRKLGELTEREGDAARAERAHERARAQSDAMAGH